MVKIYAIIILLIPATTAAQSNGDVSRFFSLTAGISHSVRDAHYDYTAERFTGFNGEIDYGIIITKNSSIKLSISANHFAMSNSEPFYDGKILKTYDTYLSGGAEYMITSAGIDLYGGGGIASIFRSYNLNPNAYSGAEYYETNPTAKSLFLDIGSRLSYKLNNKFSLISDIKVTRFFKKLKRNDNGILTGGFLFSLSAGIQHNF